MRRALSIPGLLPILILAACGEEKSTPPARSSPPANVGSFRAAAVGWSYLLLDWTAPAGGREGEGGLSYDLRISDGPIDDGTWPSARRIASVPPVGTEGSKQSAWIRDLFPARRYWIGLRVVDARGESSTLAAILALSTRPRPEPSALVEIPAGAFLMGSDASDGAALADEMPRAVLELPAYGIEPTEVTNAQYAVFMEEGGYARRELWTAAGWDWRLRNAITTPRFWETGTYRCGLAWPDFPVSGISWYEASAYARWAGHRLPTEAEWEKAARGGCIDPTECNGSGGARPYPWGDASAAARSNAIASGDPYEPGPTPVGFYDGSLRDGYQTLDGRSPYGLHDMGGNVLEWTASVYRPYPYDAEDGRDDPAGPGRRVARGGGWETDPVFHRCASRNHEEPGYQVSFFGLRCARDR